MLSIYMLWMEAKFSVSHGLITEVFLKPSHQSARPHAYQSFQFLNRQHDRWFWRQSNDDGLIGGPSNVIS